MRSRSFQNMIIYPILQTSVAGLLAAMLADSIGWPAVTIGLAVALLLWTVQIIASLPAPAPAKSSPPELPKEVRLNVIADDGREGDYVQFPVDAARLQEFAAGLCAGKGLTVREWQGLFTAGEFGQMAGVMIARGLAEWREDAAHKEGRVLTTKGRQVMEGLAK